MLTNYRKNSHSRANHKLHLAVLAALPLMVLASFNASAACTGTIASPSTTNSISVLCNGADPTPGAGEGNLTITPVSSLIDTTTQTANGSNTLLQFDGEGRTLTNSGTISNTRIINVATGTLRGRTAVLMGAATLNAGAGTLFTIPNTPVSGVTTVTLNAAPTAAYVGQTVVFGRYNADQGDFPAGEARVITAVNVALKTVTFATPLSAAYAGAGTDPIGYKVVSNFGGGHNVVNNSGTISAQILASEINANKNLVAVTATSIANGVGNIATAIGASSAAYAAAAKGVTMSVEGIYQLNNAAGGTISVKNEGIGAAYAVEQGGAATELTVVNNGTISAERNAHVTLVDNLARNSAVVAAPNATTTSFSATTATSSDFAFATKQNLASVNAINTQEEGDLIDITNGATGIIRAAGDYAGAIYMRNVAQIINNEGLIEWVAAAGHAGARGYAIGSVSDGGEIRTLDLTNSGAIKGDILAVNGMAERWHNLSTEGVLDSRLNINTQFGQQDSTITNAGTIIGNVYLSNGTHVLTNEAGATLTGNIDLDQRDTTCGQASAYQAGCAIAGIGANAKQTAIVEVVSTAGSKSQTVNVYNVNPAAGTVTSYITGFTVASTATNTTALVSNATASTSVKTGIITTVGTKNFTFENAGDFTGNITIRTASSKVLGGAAPVASNVTLIPTITGSGAGSSLLAPSHNIEGMGNILTIDATAGAGLVTVAPKSIVTVHTGEYFLVANSLVGATPLIDSMNTPLVNWSIAKNANGNLVVGVDSLNSAATIAGVSKSSAIAVDALLMANSTSLGALLQNPTTLPADIEKAGQQLRPEANNASMQATIAAVDHVSSVIGVHQDETRTASNGNSGISTGEAAQGLGFWMQGFGFKGDQGKRGGIDGYTANTGGFVLGGDTLVGNGDFRVGGALGYASTGIDGAGVNLTNKTDIDSYQGSLYGSWNAGTWYVDAAIGYGKHQYDTKRYVALANASITGSHDANQYLAKIGGGYPVKIGKVTVTPVASMTYVNLDQDGYTEIDRSNSGAALTVASTKTDSFRSGLGAKISVPLSEGSMKTAVEARAMWNHEFADTNQDIAARFAGGTNFTTNGVSQARDSANLGLGLSLSTANGQNLSVNYDAEVKSDYIGHTASVKFRYDF